MDKEKDNVREFVRARKELAGIKVTNMVGTFLNEDSSATAHRWFPENHSYAYKSGN